MSSWEGRPCRGAELVVVSAAPGQGGGCHANVTHLGLVNGWWPVAGMVCKERRWQPPVSVPCLSETFAVTANRLPVPGPPSSPTRDGPSAEVLRLTHLPVPACLARSRTPVRSFPPLPFAGCRKGSTVYEEGHVSGRFNAAPLPYAGGTEKGRAAPQGAAWRAGWDGWAPHLTIGSTWGGAPRPPRLVEAC